MLRESPAKLMLHKRCKGSFDCVVLRYSQDNFAQDDKLMRSAPAASPAE